MKKSRHQPLLATDSKKRGRFNTREALAAPAHEIPGKSAETLQVQRERIVKEVRDSLTHAEIEALAQFFKPVFEAGLWPVP